VRAWDLEILCANPAEYSAALTAVMMPEGHSADAFRKITLDRFNLSLGQGLGKLSGKVFRIGHLGYFNDLMLCGTLAGVEMGLELAAVPRRKGGIQAATDYLAASAATGLARAAGIDPAKTSISRRRTCMNRFMKTTCCIGDCAGRRRSRRGAHKARRDAVRRRWRGIHQMAHDAGRDPEEQLMKQPVIVSLKGARAGKC
jgi:hypothetical protein